MFSQSFIYHFQNKAIKVTVKSPVQPESQNQQHLIEYLKKIYLQKMEESFHA